MSTRFYYGQKDYIAQLNAMDDVAVASQESALAKAEEAAASAAAAATSESNAAAAQQDAINKANDAHWYSDRAGESKDAAAASQAAAAGSQATAAQSAADASTYKDSAAQSKAGADASAAAAATSQANAHASEVAAAGSATTADQRASDSQWYKERAGESQVAAAGSATAAATSETNAAGSAATAATHEGNAAQQATNAAGSATAAAGSAQAAASSAGDSGWYKDRATEARDAAAGSAGAAATSAANAAGSESRAKTSEQNAAQSAADAQAAFLANQSGQVQADWNVTDASSKAFIQNKPSPTLRANFAAGGQGSVTAENTSLRAVANPLTSLGYSGGVRFRFASANDVDAVNGYADVIDLSTYIDSSGGGVNALYLNKSSQYIQHKFASAGGNNTWVVKTLAYTDGDISGAAGRLNGPAHTNGSDGWFRSQADAGWYNETYNVGIYATEAGNVRTYNHSSFISGGDVTATGSVIASGAGGFTSASYVMDSRNPIWRFGNADPYGISYFQAGSGIAGNDTIGFHFGTPTAAGSKFSIDAVGTVRAANALVTANGTDGEITVGNNPNGSIELGMQGRASAGTPFIDFHSSANSGDYDVRVMASGGSASGIGQGLLNVMAGAFQQNGYTIWNALNMKPVVQSDGYSQAIGGLDLNGIQTSGFYRGANIVNAPDSGWWYVVVEGHDTSWTKQTATAYGSANGVLPGATYIRTMQNNGWSGWTPISDGGYGMDYVLKRRRNRYHADDGTSLNNIVNPETGFDYDTAGAGITGPFLHFGGLSSAGDYACQIKASYNDGGNTFKFRTRNNDVGGAPWNGWKTVWNDGNLPVSVAPVANTAVLRDQYGYIYSNHISTLDDSDGGTGGNGNGNAVTAIMVKQGDNWHRGVNAQHVKDFLGLRTFTVRQIGAAEDLNSYYVQGGMFGLSGSPTNTPANGDGQLLVLASPDKDTTGQIYMPYASSDMFIRSSRGWGAQWTAWATVMTNFNIGTCAPSLTGGGATGTWNISILGGANYATSAGSANTATSANSAAVATKLSVSGNSATFNWQGQGGQPTWLWGGSDPSNMYVYNPSNFSVSYASSAGNTSSVSNATSGSYTWTGAQYFNSGFNTAGGSAPALMASSTNNGGAVMAFHRVGNYAVNMGLDSDNVIRIGGWSAPANLMQLDMSGNVTFLANVTAYSDERKKTNWRDIPLGFVASWAGVKCGVYDRIDTGEQQVGLSAQAVQAVLPDAVSEGQDGFLSLNYGAAAAVASVELAKEVVELRKQLKQQAELIKLLIAKVGI